jgi:Rrf2 family protein
MPTSTRFAVAVHALAALAVNGGGPVRSEQIAASASTNAAVVRGLFSRLAEAGLTGAQLGAGGGAILARSAARITLLDVYRAVEEPEFFAMHRSEPDRSCFVGRSIQEVLRATTDRAQAALEQELARVTVADVARDILARATEEERHALT